jgi:thiamine biosynthesis lipoprotein
MNSMNSIKVRRRAMATTFEIVLIGDDRDFLAAAGNEALDEVERLEEQLSVYVPTSEVSWLNERAAFEPVRVEPRLFDLLQLAARISEETQGAFDITAGPLVKAWGFYRQQGVVPTASETSFRQTIAQTLEHVGMSHVILDEGDSTVRFDRAGVEINLGSIGKGYAVDRAAAVLRNLGVEAALIHGGYSTIYALGALPDADGWVIGIRHPLDEEQHISTVTLRDQALSTSGSYEQFFEVDGKRYSHILDPRTGAPAQGMLSSTVITSSATESDALSTAFFVLGEEGARAYCSKHPEVSAVLAPETLAGEDVEVVVVSGEW